MLAFPNGVRVPEDSELRIRIRKSQHPKEFELTAYRRVDRDEYPIGDGRELPVTLERVMRNGETVAWDAVFQVKVPDRHYYLYAFGVWRDVRGNGDQDASWTYHVRT